MKSVATPPCDETCPAVDLRIRDVECPELLAELCLIPPMCSLAIWLQTNGWILSTSRLKHLSAINNLGLRLLPFTPVALLLYELASHTEAVELCESLPSIIARQRAILSPGTSTGPCLTASNHEIRHHSIM